MNDKLEQQLAERYPQIFRDIYGDPQTTCLAFGIECRDGWFDLIDSLCDDIMITVPPPDFKADQVKEKFGGLRFYVSNSNDEIDRLISAAEDDSYKTCERCGSTDGVEQRGRHWIVTECETCHERHQS
jgi:hypothetical protein